MNKKSSTAYQHPKVPPDRILINDKWKGTKLGQELCQRSGGMFTSGLGIVDFYPCEGLSVLYFTTADYESKDHKRRLKAFYEVCKTNGVVIADRNSATTSDFSAVQEFATFSLNLFVFPVTGAQEVPDVLKDLGYVENSSPNNPFSLPPEHNDLASKQLALLTLIPNVGRKKAQELLAKLGHVRAVSEASEDQLSAVVGAAAAKHVQAFFHNKHTPQ